MSKVYISGKITGQSNYMHLFRMAEIELMQLGYQTVNPTLLQHEHDRTWGSYMKECIKAMMDCDTVYMMSNWIDSEGAIIERAIAQNLKYRIIYQNK